MMGDDIKQCTESAILNANYMLYRLKDYYTIKYTNKHGFVSHEFIIDLVEFKKHGIGFNDIAKRLQDYSYHAPTVGWPIDNTMMIEPTESETLKDLDQFCDVMISIRKEIQDVVDGEYTQDNNLIVNAPHTTKRISSDDWDSRFPYSRKQAVYPMEYLENCKQWPTVSKVNNAYGDMHPKVKYD